MFRSVATTSPSPHEQAPMSRLDLAVLARELAALQRLAARLTVDRRDPEKFHVDKDELVKRLAAARRRLELN
jgi:hypothetical protein